MPRLLHFGVITLIAWISLMLVGGALAVSAQMIDQRAAPEYPAAIGASANFPNCRFGVGGNVQPYGVTALNIGWHMDWTAQLNPAHPNSAEYIQVVRIKPAAGGYTFNPPVSTLYAIMDQNPGAIWLIGNEPDSPFQDNLRPEIYAKAYHQLYYLIKQHDPSARIGAGNIVQPTPLRMLYLDRVLSSYQQTYGEWLPADLWSIHSYILREIDPSDPGAYPNGPYEVWGAYIPPGITVTRGLLYSYSDMFNQSIFQQRLLAFRAWMRDRGYRDKPLYITEYGTLFPYPPYTSDGLPYVDENGVPMTEDRTAAFMTGTFGLLRGFTDANVGYPADADHVVQRWLWYSLSDVLLGGPLFDPSTYVRRPLGDVFANYTSAISREVDLLAVRLTTDPLGNVNVNQPQTVTLRALIANAGNISITPPITVEFYSGYPPTGTLIGSRSITYPLNGCGETVAVSMTWPNLTAGLRPVYTKVTGNSAVSETGMLNNVASGTVLIAPPRLYLPVVLKTYPWMP